MSPRDPTISKPKHVINFSTMKIAVWGLGPPFRAFLCIWTSSHREYHEKSGGCWPLSSPTSAFRWYTNAYFHRCAPHRSPSWGCVAWPTQYDHPPRSGPRYLDLSDLAMGWKFRGYPNGWLVDFMENPLKLDDWGYPHDLGNLHAKKMCILHCHIWLTESIRVSSGSTWYQNGQHLGIRYTDQETLCNRRNFLADVEVASSTVSREPCMIACIRLIAMRTGWNLC